MHIAAFNFFVLLNSGHRREYLLKCAAPGALKLTLADLHITVDEITVRDTAYDAEAVFDLRIPLILHECLCIGFFHLKEQIAHAVFE